MEIDIAQLAAQAAAFLAPFLPYLIKGGKIAAKKAFEKAGEKFTEEAWERAETLWGKMKPKVEAKHAAQEAVEEFVKDPGEEDALPALRQQIKRILAEDLSLANEISITIGQIDRSSIQTGDASILEGIPFLGFIVFPTHRRLKRRKGIAFQRKFRQLLRDHEKESISHVELTASIRGWINHVRYGDTWGLRHSILTTPQSPVSNL